MLYRLAMYALSQGFGGQATILYPTEEVWAKQEVIDIRELFTGHNRAQVVLRPVHIPTLVDAIQATGIAGERKRTQLAASLALGVDKGAVA